MDKPKSILLKEVPKDVYDTLVDVQAKVRKDSNKVFSLQSTVYKIVRESKKEEKK